MHVGVVIAAHDRAAIERLCRPVRRAHDRLTWMTDGKIAYQLKRPWPCGRTHSCSFHHRTHEWAAYTLLLLLRRHR